MVPGQLESVWRGEGTSSLYSAGQLEGGGNQLAARNKSAGRRKGVLPANCARKVSRKGEGS